MYIQTLEEALCLLTSNNACYLIFQKCSWNNISKFLFSFFSWLNICCWKYMINDVFYWFTFRNHFESIDWNANCFFSWISDSLSSLLCFPFSFINSSIRLIIFSLYFLIKISTLYFCCFGYSTKISILFPFMAPPQSWATYSVSLIFTTEP